MCHQCLSVVDPPRESKHRPPMVIQEANRELHRLFLAEKYHTAGMRQTRERQCGKLGRHASLGQGLAASQWGTQKYTTH